MEGIVYAPIACPCNSRALSKQVEIYIELIKNKVDDVLALDLVTIDNVIELSAQLNKLKNPSFLPKIQSLQKAIKNNSKKYPLAKWFVDNNMVLVFQRKVEYEKFKQLDADINLDDMKIPYKKEYGNKYILSFDDNMISYPVFMYNFILTQDIGRLDTKTRKLIFKNNEPTELEEFVIPTLIEQLTNATAPPPDEEDTLVYDKNYTNLLKTLNNKFEGKRTRFKIETSEEEKEIINSIISRYFDFQPFDKTRYPIQVRELVNERIQNMTYGDLKGEEAFNVKLTNLSINKLCCKNQIKSVGDSMMTEMNQYYEKYPVIPKQQKTKERLKYREEPIKLKYGDEEGNIRKLGIYESSITDFKARKKTVSSLIPATRPTHEVQQGYVDKINDFKYYLEKVRKSNNEEAKKILRKIENKIKKLELKAKLQLANQYQKIYNTSIINVDRMRKVPLDKAKILSLRNYALSNNVDFSETKQAAIDALRTRNIKILYDPISQANNLGIDFGHREFLLEKLTELGIEEVGERYSAEIDVFENIKDISINLLINNIISAEKTPIRNKDAAYEDFLKDLDDVNMYIEMQKLMKDI